MKKSRNLPLNAVSVLRTFLALRRYHGLFSWRDASMQLSRVLLPKRFRIGWEGSRRYGKFICTSSTEGSVLVTLPWSDLRFYWSGPVPAGLWLLLEQEFDSGNPHHYTTSPIELSGAESLILDVGACEGLFALRAVKERMARRVVCFEPSVPMARQLRRSIEDNGFVKEISIETSAVSDESGWMTFREGDNESGNSVVNADEPGHRVPAVSLDDYCGREGICLTPRDLIKVDAEGSDLRVLKGAIAQIKSGSPQIAVTTYHEENHCYEIVDWLKHVNPAYRLRLKGFSFWTERPRPVLLLASVGEASPDAKGI